MHVAYSEWYQHCSKHLSLEIYCSCEVPMVSSYLNALRILQHDGGWMTPKQHNTLHSSHISKHDDDINITKSKTCKQIDSDVRCNWARRCTTRTTQYYSTPAHYKSHTHPGTTSHRFYSTAAVNKRPDTVKAVLLHWTEKLEAAQVPEAKLSAEHITSRVLGVSRVST